jgi:hypothetical protein
MKTAKFLFGFIAIVFLTLSLTNAQPAEWQTIVLPWKEYNTCVEEWIEGTRTIELMTRPHKQIRKVNFDGIGQTSEAHYEGTAIVNDVRIDNSPDGAIARTFVVHIQMFRDNVYIGYFKNIVHVTVNANGDLVVEARNMDFFCKYD